MRTLVATMSLALAATPAPRLPKDRSGGDDGQRPRVPARRRHLALELSGGTALAQQPTIEELLQRLDALQRRVDELESRQCAPAAAPPGRVPASPPVAAVPASPPVAAIPASPPVAAVSAVPPVAAYTEPVPGLRPYEPTGAERPLRGRAAPPTCRGIAFRVPGTETEVRLYGFAKLSRPGTISTAATRPTRRRPQTSR